VIRSRGFLQGEPMTMVVGVAFVLYSGCILSLIWNTWRTARLTRQQQAELPDAPDMADWPSLDVLVPVKDEEDHIATCLNSVLGQNYPGTRLIVVNDRSTDGTAAVVQSIQDQHPDVRRVDVAELPEGMYGKPHALASVAGKLKGEYVAFVDSDLKLNPQCLKTLVYHLRSNGLDWVAVMGAPATSMFWERLTIPIFGAIAFAWYDPRKISDPNWSDAIGSGLMVCRRRAYKAIGGHAAVIRTYDEDSELLRIAKRAGQKVSFLLAPELFTQKHYGSLAATIRGMTRTCVGGIKTVPRMLVTINALNFVSLVPIGVLILLALAAWYGRPVMWGSLWLLAACIHLLASTALACLVFHAARSDRRLALLHPLGSAIALGVCLRALVHLKQDRPVTWRGTQY